MSDAAPDRTAALIALHVLSGVHLGARIDLSAGTWLLGSDDECDFIFNGLNPHHATLCVTETEDGTVSVTVTPQDGRVIAGGAAADGETPLEAGAAWYLGDTCFAWNLPGVVQETLIPQSAAPVVNGTVVDSSGVGETAAGDDASKVAEQPNAVDAASGAPERETLSMDANLPAESPGFQPLRIDDAMRTPRLPWRQRLRRPVPLLLLAVLLCALSFTFSTGPSRSEYPGIVNDILKKAGLTGLAVTPRWPGVEVRGAVAAAPDLERLKQAVEEVSFPVYLEVAVDDDLLRAVRNALGVRGFSPAVRMERGSGEPQLLVAAYMRDALVEADAFARLEKDVPPPPVKRRRVLHEKDVAPLLQTTLQNAGFNDIQPVFMPGRVSLTGNLSPDRTPVLERLKAGLSAHFGVPLFGEDMVDGNARLFANERGAGLTLPGRTQQAKQSEEAHQDKDPLGGLKLTGVFAAPLDFVTTEDGSRLFPGAVLPNGNVLESITTTQLTLRRGDKVFTYSLRGNHE
ncbi:MAG: type III secretion system inner membrane ring subunit SctD [Desulfovibrio sp.]|nr:type III secretion system inner membrane ring subunit SctD [Desulfovibrio sp.]